MLIPLSRLADPKSSNDDLENLAELVRGMVHAMEQPLDAVFNPGQKQEIEISLDVL
jgi:hypothetical protein